MTNLGPSTAVQGPPWSPSWLCLWLWTAVPFRYIEPRADIYLVKGQLVIPGHLPPSNLYFLVSLAIMNFTQIKPKYPNTPTFFLNLTMIDHSESMMHQRENIMFINI